jgi:hypothetical protein
MNMPPEAMTYMMLKGMSEGIQHETIGAYQKAIADGDYKGLFPHLDDYLAKAHSLQDSGIGPGAGMRLGNGVDPVKGLLLNQLYSTERPSVGDQQETMYRILANSDNKYNSY